MEDDGQAGADFSDLNPQTVDVHTILPRIPAIKLGMNALGHTMLHVHSDEAKLSSEILSSGLTAGFALTNRVKGLQDRKWLLYSSSESATDGKSKPLLRLRDEDADADVLTIKDGSVTVLGNKVKDPRLTITGKGKSVVPRLTLVSTSEGVQSFVSLYNRFGKFGIFAGASDQSVFHVNADGSEMALVSGTVHPHVLVQSTAENSCQEVRLRGKNSQVNIFHKSGAFGICQSAKNTKCKSFLQVEGAGQDWNFISHTSKIGLKISHQPDENGSDSGGEASVELISPTKRGATSTKIMNRDSTFIVQTSVKDVSKDVFHVTKNGDGKFYGELEVGGEAHFQNSLHVKGDVFVTGEVTMQGGHGVTTLNNMLSRVQDLEHENRELRSSRDKLMSEFRDMQNDLRGAEAERETMKNQMQSMLQTMQMVKEMQELSTRTA
jgi:hypothetical protein